MPLHDYRPDEFHAIDASVKGEGGVFPAVADEPLGLRAGDVGRIRRDEIESSFNTEKEIGLDEADRWGRQKPPGVFPCDIQGRRRDIGG